ncbi:MAG TPA: glycosyltransferase family 39 protein [Anaerolineales bacterium]|nr:glycosyltransferase family 39 protein [Anaerolineales bacterium]
MNAQTSATSWLRRSGWAILLIALLQFVLHLWVNLHDNFFRDELYYMAAGQHLAAGYVEYPPFIAWATAFSRAVFGDSVAAIRLLPSIAAAAIVFLTADMVAVMGGGFLPQLLAAFAVALCPVFIGSSGLMSMDPFDQLWWVLASWVLVRLIRSQNQKMWLLFGVVVGFGLLTKLVIGFFVIAVLFGLLLSGQRKLLFSWWLIAAGAIALVMMSPYLVWQAQHGFPVLEYTRAYSSGKTFQATPLEYFAQQVLSLNPLALPLWLGGLYFVFFTKAGSPYRAFGWAYVFLYIFFMLQHAKFYWLSPMYPVLFAAGAYGLELLVQQRPRLKWMQPTYIWTIAISGLLLVPFSIPILPVQAFLRYYAITGGRDAGKAENLTSSALPQNYADRYGWKEMVAVVKQAYDTLTPQEKAEACIFADNYGEAGAVDFYGAKLGLPHAISGQNSYYMWGPQGCTGKVIITINSDKQDLVGSFDSVEPGGQVKCQYCMPFENNAAVFIARGLKYPMEQVWPTVKNYN